MEYLPLLRHSCRRDAQGARGLNRLVADAFEILARRSIELTAIHQVGPADLEAMQARYAGAGLPVQGTPFIDDVAAAYRAADLVIARSGVTTVAELEVAGRPAVLLPYTHAVDDYQWFNARQLVEAGAALSFRERDTTPERLADELATLLGDPARRESMARAMAARVRPDAAARILDECRKVARCA